MCWVGRVPAKDSTGRDHAHGRAASLHGMNLHGRRLGTERKSVRGVEGILHGPGRMTLRDIQCVKVVEVRFDLAVVFDRIAKRDKDVLDLLSQKRDRMKVATARTPA